MRRQAFHHAGINTVKSIFANLNVQCRERAQPHAEASLLSSLPCLPDSCLLLSTTPHCRRSPMGMAPRSPSLLRRPSLLLRPSTRGTHCRCRPRPSTRGTQVLVLLLLLVGQRLSLESIEVYVTYVVWLGSLLRSDSVWYGHRGTPLSTQCEISSSDPV